MSSCIRINKQMDNCVIDTSIPKLCTQKFSTDIKKLLYLLRVTKDNNHKNKLSSALRTSFVWPSDKKFINVGFVESQGSSASGIEIENYGGVTTFIDLNGNTQEFDPLQIQFDNQENFDIKEAIKKILNETYNKFCGVKFIFDNSLPYDVKVAFKPNESWSYIGTESTKYDISLNLGWFNVATVLHEFGHALGLIHEHQNPVDNPIKWNKQAVYEYYSGPPNYWNASTIDNNILSMEQIDNITGSQFDPLSIMIYWVPSQLTENNVSIPQNSRLSGLDVLTLSDSRHYPGGDMTPQEFYKYAYNKDIDVSLKESGKGTRSKPSNPYIAVGIGIGVILIILFLIIL